MEKPFEDREEVKAEIRRCAIVNSVLIGLAFTFLALGVICDALNITLGLESMSWFLLAIFFGLFTIMPLGNVLELRLKEMTRAVSLADKE
jgi:hypothetical protein